MPEQQNIEYKSSWHDEYLKWIGGFANAQGGRIYIGKDNEGATVGLDDYQSLMDEIPNKIKNNLGITAEVNLLQEDGKYFIEISIQPYSAPISLRGRYYYRCGSVKKLGLNERQIKAVEYVMNNNNITTSAYAEIFNVSVRTARKDLTKLVEIQIFKRIGETNLAKYDLS